MKFYVSINERWQQIWRHWSKRIELDIDFSRNPFALILLPRGLYCSHFTLSSVHDILWQWTLRQKGKSWKHERLWQRNFHSCDDKNAQLFHPPKNLFLCKFWFYFSLFFERLENLQWLSQSPKRDYTIIAQKHRYRHTCELQLFRCCHVDRNIWFQSTFNEVKIFFRPILFFIHCLWWSQSSWCKSYDESVKMKLHTFFSFRTSTKARRGCWKIHCNGCKKSRKRIFRTFNFTQTSSQTLCNTKHVKLPSKYFTTQNKHK